MSTTNRSPDPDDFFSDTRMSFGDHIEDLRVHLWRAVKGFLVACVFGFIIGRSVLAFIAYPVSRELEAFYERRERKKLEMVDAEGPNDVKRADERTNWYQVEFLASQFQAVLKGDLAAANGSAQPPRDIDDGKIVVVWMREHRPVLAAAERQAAQRQFGKSFALTTLSVQEAFMVYLKVSLVTGFVIGAPWIFYQVWSFIAVGLYPNEKRLVNVYMPFSVGLFIGGVLLCEFFVIPKAVEALLWFNEWIGLEPDLRLSEWLGFAIMMPLIFGISFQTPLAMLFVYRIGLMGIDTFREKRRIIWFFMAAFAAIITPSTDPYSMMFLWIPLCLLFELGIWLCMLSPQAEFDVDVPDSEEVVEV